ncbi:MAG: rhodanese-like domain-containing protein [Sulfurospirillum sp.]
MFLKLLFFILIFASLGVSDTLQEPMPVIVSVGWLKTHLNDKDVIVIDVRKNKDYRKRHIKGAVNMPVMKDFFTKKTLKMPKLTYLKELFSNAGIDTNTKVIVYDNGQFCWAARVCWVLKVLGHKNESLLRYGYGDYIKSNLPISKKSPKKIRTEFILRVNDEMIATKLDVLIAIQNKEPILDGRSRDMYMGKTSIAKRYGHIPTAQLFSGANNYKITADGNKLKSFDELKSIYKSMPKNKKIIIYCQDGADAALDDILMRKLGYKTSVYEGSWIEWGNDDALPIVNPSKKSKI